jgi:hypothetical protein
MLYPTVADVNKGSKSIIRQTKKKKKSQPMFSRSLSNIQEFETNTCEIPEKFFFFKYTEQ